jgi:hypothetical protein
MAGVLHARNSPVLRLDRDRVLRAIPGIETLRAVDIWLHPVLLAWLTLENWTVMVLVQIV